MATKQELLALAERVEALTGPDREVDVAIGRVRYGDADVRYGGVGWPCGAIIVPCTPGWMELPRYTASLDAALALAPPDWHLILQGVNQSWHADLRTTPFGTGGHACGFSSTPALALTAAALRALAQQSTAAQAGEEE